MADILVFNALKDVEAALNVANGLMISAADIRSAVDATLAAVDYTGVTETAFDLSRLSCNQEIASCTSNHAGAGTNSAICQDSPWIELDSVNTETIFEKISTHNEMHTIIGQLTDINNTSLINNIKQYVELYAKEAIEKLGESDDKVRLYWLKSSRSSFFSTSLKVCSANYCSGVGATCTWTVPSNTTQAKFQVWGAGAGSNPGCCCGGSSFGANGAYSELTIGVTPGDTYTICAGCACGYYCCSSTAPGCACMSGVTGNGICCLKSDGACHNNCAALNSTTASVGTGGTCYRFQNNYCTSSGPCWCSNGEYCFDNSCATCGIVPVHADCCTRTYCACGTDTTEVSKGGYRPIHGGGCLDTNMYGYHTRPPILDSDTCKEFTGGCACGTFTSGTCCGGCNGNSWTRHPGMGGAHTTSIGGTNNHKGGTGTGGMVQVSWK